MRYLVVTAILAASQPVVAQSLPDNALSELSLCLYQASWDCAAVPCLPLKVISMRACRIACEHSVEKQPTTEMTRALRADEMACFAEHRESGIRCKDREAWRAAEIAARQDAFDFAAHEYSRLIKLSADEIVQKVYRIAELGLIASGGCLPLVGQGRSVTLLYTTALAINRVRAVGTGLVRWEQAQALSLQWLRARRGY